MSPPLRRDAGSTLVELLVAMSLTSILLALLATVFISDVRTTSSISAKVDATADARLAADVMTRRLRVAFAPEPSVAAIASATASSVSFYASVAGTATTSSTDPAPTKVTYQVVDTVVGGVSTSCLQQEWVSASGTTAPYTYAAADTRRTCLIRGRINPGGGPVFTYYSSGTGTDTTADPTRIVSVGISLEVQDTSGGRSATTHATTRVTLSNVHPVQDPA